jgi:hypothetical protein
MIDTLSCVFGPICAPSTAKSKVELALSSVEAALSVLSELSCVFSPSLSSVSSARSGRGR